MMHEMERALPRVGELNQPQVMRAPLSKRGGRVRQQLAFFLSRLGRNRVVAGGLSREVPGRTAAADSRGHKCAS